jgi:phospholipase/carboxylesterase
MMAQHGPVLKKMAEDLARAMDEFSPRGGSGSGIELPLLEACRLVTAAVARFNASENDLRAGVINAMRAGRKVNQALELLFGLRKELPPADAYFSEAQRPGGEDDAVVHLGSAHDPYARGNASLYVPGGVTGPRPLVVALHGGYGHGRDYLWTWMRQARSRGFFLLAPTSLGETWSIMNPAADLGALLELIGRLGEEYPLDAGNMLLTGFSDGATFSLCCAKLPDVPFRAFNPISGVLPPGDLSHARARRILWIHGAHDWMFQIARVKWGCEALQKAGADVTLKIREDLAHAVPREENPAILSWFDPLLFP